MTSRTTAKSKTALKPAANLRRLVGQLMIVGLAGPELSATERAWLRLLQPSGIILFRRNVESVEQTRKLLADASEAAQGAAAATNFRCVDIEGGVVNRARDVIAPIPSAAAVGASGKPSLFRKHGRLIGRVTKALGFNTTFAPVLDLALPQSAAVMQARSASEHPVVVAAYGAAFLEGLAAEGILGSGKHFPGLGGGTLDSHHALPLIDRAWDDLWQQDLLPYRMLAAQLPIVMVAHAAFPSITRDTLPASISPYWVTTILRGKLGYRGLILSDDMEMGGILTQAPMEEAAIRAIGAGIDLIEICHSPELIFRAYEALLTEAERSPAFAKRIHESAQRISRARKSLPIAGESRVPSSKQIDKLRSDISGFAATVEKAGAA